MPPRFSSCCSDTVSNASILITVWSFQLFFLRLCLLPSTLQVPSSAQDVCQLKALCEYKLKQHIWFLLNHASLFQHMIHIHVHIFVLIRIRNLYLDAYGRCLLATFVFLFWCTLLYQLPGSFPCPSPQAFYFFVLIILFDFSLLEIKDSICFALLLLENVNAVYQRAQSKEGLPFGQNYIPKYCLGYITCMSALSRSQLCFCQHLRQYFNVKNNIQCFPREYLFRQTLSN